MGFICLTATEPPQGDSLLFTHSIPSTSWYLFNRPRKNEKLSWTWIHPAVLNLGSLDWGSNTLTTRQSLVYTYPSPFYIWANIVQFQWYTVRATDEFFAQSIFHSSRSTNLQFSFRTIKQNKSLLLVTNDDCLILLAQKKI